MPIFVPKPGHIKSSHNSTIKIVRTVVRTRNNITRSVVAKNGIRSQQQLPKPVKRINPPNTVSQQSKNSVRVVERKRPQLVRDHKNRSRSVVHSAVRAQHDTLVAAYTSKINDLKNMGQGRILVMVACGPSISEIPIEKLNNVDKIDIMSINKPDPRVWPTTYWAFCDQTQYKRNEDLFDKYTGTIINSSSIRVRHRKQVLIRNRSGSGFSLDLTQGFFIGRSTTYANMQTALWMNYDRIYILGMDMAAVERNGEKILHYYGKNPDVSDTNREKRFEIEAKSYEFAAGYLPEVDRKKFYMCSSYNKWGFTSRFNNRPHENIIDEILNYANSINQK